MAVAGALAVLPLAALVGCSAAAPEAAHPALPAYVAQATVQMSATGAPVALQFPPQAPAASGPPPAAIAKFRWSALAGSPLGYRNAPILAWPDGWLLEFGGFVQGSTRRSAAGAAFDPTTGKWRRIANAPPGGSFAADGSSAVWTGRYLAVASGTPIPAPGIRRPPRTLTTGTSRRSGPDPTAWGRPTPTRRVLPGDRGRRERHHRAAVARPARVGSAQPGQVPWRTSR